MANPDYDVDQPDGPYNDPGAPATIAESVAEYTRNVGAENQDQEWILSHFDSWERNPFYTGKPGRHPEDDSEYDEGDFSEGGSFQENEGQEKERTYNRAARSEPEPIDDEIPF